MTEAATSDMTVRAQIEKNVCDDNKRLFRTNAHLYMSTSDIEHLVAPDPAHGKDAYLESSQYCVSEVIPGTKTMRYFHVIPDVATVLPLADYVENTYEGEAADIAGGLRSAIAPELRDLENKQKLADSIFWNKVMMGAMLYITGKQMGMTQKLDSFVAQSFRAILDTPSRIAHGDFEGLWKTWRGIFKPTSPILTDFTEQVRYLSVPLTETGQAVLDGFDAGELPHVIEGGPSGSGKGYDVRSAAAAAVQGRSDVEAFQGKQVRFVQISVDAVIREGGSWLNGAETVFLRTLKRISGGNDPIIVQLTEADQLTKAGMGTDNKPLNLWPRLYKIMEGEDPAYRNLHFVAESTRWQEIEAAAPDVLRRTSFVEKIPPRPQEVREALEIGIAMRRAGKEGLIQRARYMRTDVTPEALDAMTIFGIEERGAPPSSHLRFMNNVVRRKIKATPAGSRVFVEVDDVIKYVAAKRACPVDAVKQELQMVASTGIMDDPTIQQHITEAFYRNYVPGSDEGRAILQAIKGTTAEGPVSTASASPVVPSTAGAFSKAVLEAELAKHFKSWSSLTPERREVHFNALSRSWQDGTPAMRWAYRTGSGIDVAKLAQDYYRHSLEKRAFDQRTPTEAERAEDRMRRERELKSFKGLPI